jgi:hypothetical protein
LGNKTRFGEHEINKRPVRANTGEFHVGKGMLSVITLNLSFVIVSNAKLVEKVQSDSLRTYRPSTSEENPDLEQFQQIKSRKEHIHRSCFTSSEYTLIMSSVYRVEFVIAFKAAGTFFPMRDVKMRSTSASGETLGSFL